MAATFDQLATIQKDAGFQGRCQYATVVAAINVYSEAFGGAGQPTAAQHAVRATCANRVLSGSFNFTSVYWAVLQNLAIVAEANPSAPPDFAIPDADIQFQVNSIWNALAGA